MERRNFIKKAAIVFGSIFAAPVLANTKEVEKQDPQELDGVPRYEIMTVDSKSSKIKGIYQVTKKRLLNIAKKYDAAMNDIKNE